MGISLDHVYPATREIQEALWGLLDKKFAETDINISHKSMPTYVEHCDFVNSIPYLGWYIVRASGYTIGSAYITRQGEIGVYIDPDYRKHDVVKKTIAEIARRHPRSSYLFNVNPRNKDMIKILEDKGAKLLQSTYEFMP